MYIRKLTACDLEHVVRLHRGAYAADHFTAKFSTGLLQRYYREIVQLNQYSFVALDSRDVPVGFVIGGLNTVRAIRRFTVKHAFVLVTVLLRNPEFLGPKLLAGLGFGAKLPPVTRARLLSIAVESGSQGRGVGNLLVDHFEEALLVDHISEYGLSVRSENVKAIRFYERHGLRLDFQKGTAKYYSKHLTALV